MKMTKRRQGCIEGLEKQNDQDLDNTPLQHPAFSRGQDDGVRGACMRIEQEITGNKEAGRDFTTDKALKTVRESVRRLKARVEEAEAELKMRIQLDMCNPAKQGIGPLSSPKREPRK